MTKLQFFKGIDNWSSHRELLWPALEMTKELGRPVLELGCGHGSTPFLQEYCRDNSLELFSYDYDHSWALQFGAVHVTNWENIPWRKEYGVVLCDESPGEQRKVSISKLHHAKIVIIHDSEVPGWNASDYKVRGEIEKYKYFYDLKSERPNAWASACSDFINVSLWQE